MNGGEGDETKAVAEHVPANGVMKFPELARAGLSKVLLDVVDPAYVR